jgi:hypothetical protein
MKIQPQWVVSPGKQTKLLFCISNKGLVEVCDKKEILKVNVVATAFCLK